MSYKIRKVSQDYQYIGDQGIETGANASQDESVPEELNENLIIEDLDATENQDNIVINKLNSIANSLTKTNQLFPVDLIRVAINNIKNANVFKRDTFNIIPDNIKKYIREPQILKNDEAKFVEQIPIQYIKKIYSHRWENAVCKDKNDEFIVSSTLNDIFDEIFILYSGSSPFESDKEKSLEDILKNGLYLRAGGNVNIPSSILYKILLFMKHETGYFSEFLTDSYENINSYIISLETRKSKQNKSKKQEFKPQELPSYDYSIYEDVKDDDYDWSTKRSASKIKKKASSVLRKDIYNLIPSAVRKYIDKDSETSLLDGTTEALISIIPFDDLYYIVNNIQSQSKVMYGKSKMPKFTGTLQHTLDYIHKLAYNGNPSEIVKANGIYIDASGKIISTETLLKLLDFVNSKYMSKHIGSYIKSNLDLKKYLGLMKDIYFESAKEDAEYKAKSAPTTDPELYTKEILSKILENSANTTVYIGDQVAYSNATVHGAIYIIVSKFLDKVDKIKISSDYGDISGASLKKMIDFLGITKTTPLSVVKNRLSAYCKIKSKEDKNRSSKWKKSSLNKNYILKNAFNDNDDSIDSIVDKILPLLDMNVYVEYSNGSDDYLNTTVYSAPLKDKLFEYIVPGVHQRKMLMKPKFVDMLSGDTILETDEIIKLINYFKRIKLESKESTLSLFKRIFG